MAEDRRIVVNGNHNITGYNVSNVGNVTNIIVSHPVGPSGQPLKLDSKVAFSALLNSAERYPAPYCHPDTRVTVQKVVKDWIARKGHGSEKSIMWISGGPGVGKSAILQTVCVCDSPSLGDDVSAFVDIEEHNNLIDASYFFGRGISEREKASFFPTTIAYQLVYSRVLCGAAIQSILAKRPYILLESFPSQFRTLVLGPAKAHAASEAPVTIVIDALDECDNACDQVALLHAIFEAATTANMRFVIASRPEQDIHAFFKRTNVARHTYHVRLDNDFKARRDIEIFLCAKFADIRERKPALCPRLPNGEDWPGSTIICRFRDKSDGQFIYATLVIAFIDTPYFSPDQQLKYLLAAPPSRAFSKLDVLYRQILTRSPPELSAGCDELLEFQGLIKRILRVVVFWPDALTAAEIADIVGKEVGVVQAIILGPMCSLFKFSANDLHRPTITIMLCHKSLRDYLLNRLRSQNFFLPTESPDVLYIEFLSRRPPPDTPESYSRKDLINTLVVVEALNGAVDVLLIASFLDVTPNIVEGVISGPVRAIFGQDSFGNIYLSALGRSVWKFLLNAGRAGEFFISTNVKDALFIQFLSRQPPPDPPQSYSRGDLVDVLVVVEAMNGGVDVPRIASFLGVGSNAVESIIRGRAKALFEEDSKGNVYWSGLGLHLWGFLLDAGRAGEFFIPRHVQDTLPILRSRILQRLFHSPWHCLLP